MRSLVALATILSMVVLASGAAPNYSIATADWNAYQAAVANARIKDSSPFRSLPRPEALFPAPVFGMKYNFASNCAEATNGSTSFNNIKTDLSTQSCSLLKWIPRNCVATLTIRCTRITGMTSFISRSKTISNAQSVHHWYLVNYDNSFSADRRHAKRGVARNETQVNKRQNPPPYMYPDPAVVNDAEMCLAENDANGFDLPFETRPRWHVQSLSQNNGPVPTKTFPKNSVYSGFTRGSIYIADSGIDAQHPEFIDANGLSRVEDRSYHVWVDPNAAAWNSPYHDEDGHGTTVAAFAAGKTLGVYPTARIVNLKFFVANVYDCLDLDVSYLTNPVPPAGYPFLAECMGGDYPLSALVNAAQDALNDALQRRWTLAEPSVFTTSVAPRWTDDMVTPIVDCQATNCFYEFTSIMQEMVSNGVIVVIPVGNEGYYLNNVDDYVNNYGIYQPYIFELPELVVVGGSDREYNQAIYNKVGIDDTDFWLSDATGASSWGPVVDYWAPATGFNMYAMTNRVRHRENVYVPPYFKTNLASGTSFAAPQVAAGLLMYQTGLNPVDLFNDAVTPTIAAADAWAAPHVTYRMWDDYAVPADPNDPMRPPSHLGLDWGDWVSTTQVLRSFHLIPSSQQGYCPAQI